MNVLMIEVPTLERDGSVPLGVLYAASGISRRGHNVKIVDLVKDDLPYENIRAIIEDFSPEVIGLGGITSSYKRCKELVSHIKSYFPKMPIIVGGVLSSVSDLLLKKAHVGFVVHGEGEITLPNLIDTIEGKKDVSQVKGISFLRGDTILRTESQPQINNLDEIPIPEYVLLDMNKYIEPAEHYVDEYFRHERKGYGEMREKLSGRKLFLITTARGCTHKCIFCYRHQIGWRQHSVGYVVNMIKYLQETYGISVFKFNDEVTTVNKKWILKFCDSVIKDNLGIYFIILGARIDNVDEGVLAMLKKAGCIAISYGYESGSDTILKEIRKGVSKAQALTTAILTKRVGLKSVPDIIIGFPSETDKTVSETIDFLKHLDEPQIAINTPIPFPETPLWDYAVAHNIIDDKEGFILGYKRGLFVNFTRYPDKKALSFVDRVRCDVKLNWLKNRKKYIPYLRCLLEKLFVLYVKPLLPLAVQSTLRNIYHKLFPLRGGV